MNKDDMLPEEQDVEFEELITLLRQADFIDPGEQTQIIENARDRLFPSVIETPQPETAVHARGAFSSRSKAQKVKRGRLLHILNMLAAVLVIGALIGASLLLFRRHQQTTREHPTVIASMGPVQTRSLGLQMSIRVLTPGPYFLGEMLEVEIVLANHSQTYFRLLGPDSETCPGSFKAVLTGGESPFNTNLKNDLASMHDCVNMAPDELWFRPGEGIDDQEYVALTSSGSVTLTAQAGFQILLGQKGAYQPDSTAPPFEGHSPPLRIAVQRQVPPDRSITVHTQGSQVIIDAPAAARNRLFYMEISSNCATTDSRISLSRLKTAMLPLLDCGTTPPDGSFTPTPTPPRWWRYVVGAPGYLMIAGEVNGS